MLLRLSLLLRSDNSSHQNAVNALMNNVISIFMFEVLNTTIVKSQFEVVFVGNK